MLCCLPSNVLKDIPFIRLGRICSKKIDYLLNSKIMCANFIECGFYVKKWKKTRKQIAKKDRNELIWDQTQESKDSQNNISTWHPKLYTFPSILKNISFNLERSQIFKNFQINLLSPTEKTNHFLIIFWETILQINDFIPVYHLVEKANFARNQIQQNSSLTTI